MQIVISLLLCIATAFVANLYSPFLLKLHSFLFFLPVFACIAIWRARQMDTLLHVINISLSLVLLAVFTFNLAVFQHQKYLVEHAQPTQLQKLGKHIIVGYRDFGEIKAWVSRGAVGGIFITHRNVHGKTITEISHDIQQLQTIQRTAGRPPLWVAADQEGGIVAHLSPPLTELPPLSTLVNADSVDIEGIDAYAKTQSAGLKTIGVNLNLAPVVDLRNTTLAFDRHSLISQRALSDEPELVAKAAFHYVLALEQAGITATLKHFPGLGRANTDTHFFSAHITTPLKTLEQTDWSPFRQIASTTQAAIMLGHVVLPMLDSVRPASYSKAVIHGLIRQNWAHDGILLSDDFSMAPIYYSDTGIGGAAVNALNAGLDLILIAYDERQYYSVMAALLQADKRGMLDERSLQQSAARINRHISR